MPLLTQDFQSFTNGDNLSGVEVLPGVSVTTNLSSLEAFNGNMFAIGDRSLETTEYNIALTGGNTAFAFDITAFESGTGFSVAGGPGLLTVNFSDLTSSVFDVFGNAAGDPIFIGLVSDTAITSVVWAEAVENGGGNEETALDNFRVASVPSPGTLGLLVLGLVGLSFSRHRCA